MLVQKMQEKEIRWKTSFLLLSIYLCFFIFLTSCDKPDIPEFQPDPEITPGDISDRLVARIYFDATLSMQGFVVPDSTLYTQICPYLESVIRSGWGNEKVNFFRFGEQVESIDRNTYLQAGYANFYESENIFRETFIQKVIDYESQLASNNIEESTIPEKSTEIEGRNAPEETTETIPLTEEVEERKKESGLVVIVTDLFQDRGDINLLVTRLKEKYIKKGIEVGLFGLRSQFDGTVYDTGIGQAPLPYRSDPNNPETFRPFYLLVLGKHTDIAHYFDNLISNGFSEAETIIFSRYLVDPLLSFDRALIEKDNLSNRTFENSEDQRLKQYEIVESFDPAKISAKSMKYDPLPHAMSFDSDTFEVSIIAECKPDLSSKNEISIDAQQCLEATSTFLESGNGNELRVDFNLDSESLPGGTVYLYEVTLLPETNSYQAPKWCSEWDMGNRRDGSRTLNLVNFVRDLSHVTAREHEPEIAKFYFYVEKR